MGGRGKDGGGAKVHRWTASARVANAVEGAGCSGWPGSSSGLSGSSSRQCLGWPVVVARRDLGMSKEWMAEWITDDKSNKKCPDRASCVWVCAHLFTNAGGQAPSTSRTPSNGAAGVAVGHSAKAVSLRVSSIMVQRAGC